MNLCCQHDDRRDDVRRLKGRNGLDYLEISDDQLTLTVYFLGKLPPEFAPPPSPAGSTPLSHPSSDPVAFPIPVDRLAHLAVEGGRRITGIRIQSATSYSNPNPELDDSLVIQLDKYGDFSTYTLRLVNVPDADPRYERVTFSFKVNCPSDLDCVPACTCAPAVTPEPEINYLAKDYASFRQLILDRLAVVMPQWSETHAGDLGIALVELLAYTGDYLSYYQDAVATEAYLDTARQRISVRRLARLVDYFLHEGCNARAFVAVEISEDFILEPGAAFLTGLNNALILPQSILTWDHLNGVSPDKYEVFEPVASDAIALIAAHSRMLFYTWGDRECCLPRGATSATLIDSSTGNGRALQLAPGDVILLEEVIGPHTGLAADADPARRQAVRLTKVTPVTDTLYAGADGNPTPLVEIHWARADALNFTFCLSVMGPAPDCRYFSDVTVARGNVILVDHGRTREPEDLGEVPARTTTAECECVDQPGDIRVAPDRVRPTLEKGPLTYRQTLPASKPKIQNWPSAASLLEQDPRLALPQLNLMSEPSKPWEVRYDLIESQPGDWHFAVEIDDNAVPHLRFGDGTLGAQPPAGMSLRASYRTGSGVAGNVGAEAISRILPAQLQKVEGLAITVRNPLPAAGGNEPESLAEAKLYAPHTFRKRLERAITSEDYETLAERNSQVQRASARLIWTGSWYEADVAIDPFNTEATSRRVLESIEHDLEPFRRMGHDLEVLGARYVPIDLGLRICAKPHYERAHIKSALLDLFSARILALGKKGYFHPDNLTFGDGVFVSQIIAAAQAVDGVESVTMTALNRLYEPANSEIENGVLPLAGYEIAQLDNDPNFPEHGKLNIDVRGGL